MKIKEILTEKEVEKLTKFGFLYTHDKLFDTLYEHAIEMEITDYCLCRIAAELHELNERMYFLNE